MAVVAALMLGAFAFNTTENLPIGILKLMSDDMDVSLSAVGLLVSGYGLTVAVVSVPIARMTRSVPRRLVLCVLLSALFLASVVAALVSSYWVLMVCRLVTAVAQALFWAVMGPVAVGLFPPHVRGRVIGALSVGGSAALVLGVPGGTWLGQHSSWQVPFLVVGALTVPPLVLIATALPASRPEESHAARGVAPDTRRFAVVLAVTGLTVTGVFAGYTYISKFLEDESGFTESTVGTLLLVLGVTGIVGVAVYGRLLDRFPRATLTLPVATQAVALLGLFAAGQSKTVAVIMMVLLGASLGPVFMATQSQVMYVAPGRTETAVAANSAAYNAGVALGALAGGLLLPVTGVRGTFLVGGLMTVAALALLLEEQLLSLGREKRWPPVPERAPADEAVHSEP
ncbi:putative sugar efflux transporter [Streptomyces aurantiacus JA 4570]|uniref:Putative sugar efflux transporter n=1 Tax=Streptomyces aurantiacus JA 4570 TaxID=1286094 RepID=S3ZM64_9ACTN|nr:putative sugar efflux transporter [Streptomyces aurantiacus JA 4570]